MSDVIKDADGGVLDTLSVLGKRCQVTMAKGNESIVDAALMAVQAKLRIAEGEEWPGGWTDWYKVFCVDAPWSQAKLLTAGGWQHTKKTGEAPDIATVAEKVETVRAARAAHMRDVRQQEKSSREPKSSVDPTARQVDPTPRAVTLDTVKRDILTLAAADRSAIWEWLGDQLTAPAAAPPVREVEPEPTEQPQPTKATPAPSTERRVIRVGTEPSHPASATTRAASAACRCARASAAVSGHR
jgi:hypothetical protein